MPCVLHRQNEMDEHAGGLAHLLSVAEHGVRQSRDENVVIMTQVSGARGMLWRQKWTGLIREKRRALRRSTQAHDALYFIEFKSRCGTNVMGHLGTGFSLMCFAFGSGGTGARSEDTGGEGGGGATVMSSNGEC